MISEKPVALLSMLNWGLGHTTRCFPVISSLLNSKFTPIIVCGSLQQQILTKKFPSIVYHTVTEKAPRYGSSGFSTLIQLFLQAPQLLSSVKNDRQLVQKLCQEYNIQLIISDNKYGFYHPDIRSVLITHQLNLKTGWGKWLDKLVQRKNIDFIRNFHECWVPDQKNGVSLAGSLSDPHPLITNTKYIGALNRLQLKPAKGSKKVLIILSGPEPQRTIFEEKIVHTLPEDCKEIILIRGTSQRPSVNLQAALQQKNNLSVIDLADLDQLQDLISEAAYIIGRSGYTSIMEWLCNRKKTIMVPTPGQGEQEYLARYLAEKRLTYAVSQQKFDFQKAMTAAESFTYTSNWPTAATPGEIKGFIEVSNL